MAKPHYVNNTEFEILLARHKEIDGKIELEKEQKDIEDQLCVMFAKIAKGVLMVVGTGSYDEDDAIQEGVLICFLKFRKFTPGKGRAFNYHTTMVWNHFRQMYRSHTSQAALVKRFANYLANSDKADIYQNSNGIEKRSGGRSL